MDRSLCERVEGQRKLNKEAPVSYRNICAGIEDPSDCRLCV